MLLRFSGPPADAPELVRPADPTLDLGNPHNDDLLLFVYDNSIGEYLILADSATGQSAPNNVHYMAPPFLYGDATIGGPSAFNSASLPNIESSSYGPAFAFKGAAQDSTSIAGFSVWMWPSDAIRDAQNLASKGTGAAFSYETYFQFDGVNASQYGVIFGRTANGWTESAKSHSAVISTGGVTAGESRKILFGWYEDGASTSTGIVSPTEYATGELIHVVGSCKNDSAGSATCSLIVNGVTVATVSGRAIRDLAYQSEDSLEGQVMIGSSAHIYAESGSNPGFSQTSGCLNGKVFAGAIYDRAITEAEALEHYEQLWNRFE